AVTGNNLVTPVICDRLFIYGAAENLEMIGVVPVIGHDPCGGITTSKNEREEECRSAPLQDARASVFDAKAAGDLCGEQQAKRRRNWVNGRDADPRKQRP